MEPAEKKAERYLRLQRDLGLLLEGESDAIANAANTSALIFERLPELNWAGFYFRQGEELVLGPFQGRTACVRIALGRGVCGASAAEGRSLVVENVHQFDGHIACDTASNSECVVPVIVDDRVLGVLDLDSPHLGRFDEVDREGLESIVETFLAHSDVSTVSARAALES
jgi:L-methionine (R)-S-oxide reductase